MKSKLIVALGCCILAPISDVSSTSAKRRISADALNIQLTTRHLEDIEVVEDGQIMVWAVHTTVRNCSIKKLVVQGVRHRRNCTVLIQNSRLDELEIRGGPIFKHITLKHSRCGQLKISKIGSAGEIAKIIVEGTAPEYVEVNGTLSLDDAISIKRKLWGKHH